MITASIVTYNTQYDDIKQLIKCIMNSEIEKLYIIDNSSDDILSMHVSNFDNINYIHNPQNLGYGSGHNIAIRKSIEDGASYHIVINPDIYWNGDIIQELHAYMNQHADCGLIMPKILYPNGDNQYLCKLIPNPVDLILRRFIPIKYWQERHDYNYELRWSGYNNIMEVPILSGCFMMLRCEVLKSVGGFDERYFMYAEDVDLCRRIGEVASTIFYPNVSIFHKYAKGSYVNGKLMRMHMKSVFKYFNKWGWFLDKKRQIRNRNCINKIKVIADHPLAELS